ncbi:hypothetical protein [Vibrio alginolyticus]
MRQKKTPISLRSFITYEPKHTMVFAGGTVAMERSHVNVGDLITQQDKSKSL